MRDINFRAWNPHDKELCEVYTISKTYVNYITDIPEKESMCRVSLDGIILMQFTGLKDKKGIKIYEGDIVLTAENLKYEVVFDKCCYWLTNKNTVKTPLYQLFHYTMSDEKFEVIGNIYENSELLK